MTATLSPAVAAELAGLDALAATPASFTTHDGMVITVAPVPWRLLPAFARAVLPLWDDLQAHLLRAQASTPGNGAAPLMTRPTAVLTLLEQHNESLVRAVALCTGQTEEWVGALGLDDAIGLVGRVIEVNADFFVTRLLPTLNRELPMLAQRMNLLGQQPA